MGLAQAKQADAEIAAGKYKGPLHGIPWGAKDIISVKGYKTTWGSAPFKDRSFDYDASVVEMLREAGAVLIAKLTTGELAAGDQWFGGRTNSPWDPAQGSSGSSAGPGSATAAGCVGFAIGTETSGSILSPAARNGLAGLRPTFGRISRYGVMALSWTQDRLGPMCRYAEDCAIVMQAIARPDGRDMSVSDIPFNWNAQLDIKTLRVGYIKESFDDITNADGEGQRGAGARHAAVTRRDEVHSDDDSGVADQRQRARRGVGGVLRRAHASGHDGWHAHGARHGPAGAGGGVPAVAAAAHDDDDGPRRGDGGRRRVSRRLQRGRWRRRTRSRWRSGRSCGGRQRTSPRQRVPPRALAGRQVRLAPALEARAAMSAGRAGRGGRGAGGPAQPQGPAQRHSTMANLACYPAINVPERVHEAGTPTNVTFFARPFGEAELLALAKAYQDKAGHHLKKPTKLDA